ncbi:Sb-PDE family phosphodiesterase [Henriciella aquimarina]|uniref:Sb-PDE family phosphodiesterase n=1 Tax=Henriciella aquimarina TaxID=545261 RepID=UPI0009FE881B|nr:Sb-PDE family phosphodiesterase [Henriciella aquimarina]
MYRKSLLVSAAAVAALVTVASAHERAVEFPDAEDGRVILAADLHTHSVFSDGEVWPSIRVKEAQRDGLEMLAVTEHLEHQPHKADIPHPDRNRSYEVARQTLESSGEEGLSLINGAEITRGQPYGHINAVFLQDANALLTEDAEDALAAANAQGAFVFVNHPNWIPQMPDGIARLSDVHKRLIEDGLIQGIEVVNGTLDGHSEHALQLALEYGLTVLGTSDIHGLVDWTHEAGHGGHRPMTLILADGRTPEAMKAALFAGDTVAWAYDDLLGKPENVEAVVRTCLHLETEGYPDDTSVLPVDIVNACPLDFTLRNRSEETFQNASDTIHVERNDRFTAQVRMGGEKPVVALSFDVLNAEIGYREPLTLTLETGVPQGDGE